MQFVLFESGRRRYMTCIGSTEPVQFDLFEAYCASAMWRISAAQRRRSVCEFGPGTYLLVGEDVTAVGAYPSMCSKYLCRVPSVSYIPVFSHILMIFGHISYTLMTTWVLCQYSYLFFSGTDSQLVWEVRNQNLQQKRLNLMGHQRLKQCKYMKIIVNGP